MYRIVKNIMQLILPAECMRMKTFTVTPTMIISPAKVEARAGQRVQLRCQPQGQGPFNIEWVKMDGVLSPSATQTLDGVLEIRQVTAADAGRYRCVATNSAGSSDGIAVIIVQGTGWLALLAWS